MVKAAEATLPKMDMEVGGVWRPSAFASDLSSEVTAIKTAGVQIIYEVFTGPAAVVLNRQIGELQAPVVVCGVNTEGVGMGKKYWEATNGMCEFETIIAFDFQNIEMTEKTKPAWAVLVKRLGGEIPYQTAYTCYDAVYLFKEVMEKSGSLESDVLVKELENANFTATQGRVKFHLKGTKWPHAPMYGAGYLTGLGQQWQKGSLVTVWPSGRTPHPVLEAGSGWEGLKYKGTGEFLLPPRVVKAWKK
jgi:branched-chain amino acid transport system substrate-binding protein